MADPLKNADILAFLSFVVAAGANWLIGTWLFLRMAAISGITEARGIERTLSDDARHDVDRDTFQHVGAGFARKVGVLERTLYILAIVLDKYELVGAWLVLKGFFDWHKFSREPDPRWRLNVTLVLNLWSVFLAAALGFGSRVVVTRAASWFTHLPQSPTVKPVPFIWPFPPLGLDLPDASYLAAAMNTAGDHIASWLQAGAAIVAALLALLAFWFNLMPWCDMADVEVVRTEHTLRLTSRVRNAGRGQAFNVRIWLLEYGGITHLEGARGYIGALAPTTELTPRYESMEFPLRGAVPSSDRFRVLLT
jgi:hypothetical protein